MPIVDQDLGIAILRSAKSAAADRDLILISGSFDLDSIQRQPSRHETITNRLRTLQGKIANRFAVTLSVGATDDHDRQIRPRIQPARLLLDEVARATADRGTVFGEKDAIADVDQKGMPVFRRAFRLIGFQPFARFRIEFTTIERNQRPLGTRRRGRAGIFVDNAIEQTAARIFRVVG